MFIVITGLDGSGTSTVGEKLSKIDKNSILLRTPSTEYDRQLIDSTVFEISKTAHYLFYLSSAIYISDYIRKNIDLQNTNVYCVRYLLDVVVSHRVAGLNVDMDYDAYNIIKPDMTIFVHVSEKTRQDRITQRGKDNLDKILDDDNKREMYIREYKKLMGDHMTLCNEGNPDKLIRDFFNMYISKQQPIINDEKYEK